MYFVVIGILSIILALPQPLDGWVWLHDQSMVIVAVALATLLPPAYAFWMSRQALTELEDQTDDPVRGQERFGRGMNVAQGLLAFCHAIVLTTTTWMMMCAETPVVGEWPGVGGFLAAIPFILSLLLVWVAVYPADRAIRQIALEQYLFRGRPVRPVWPLGRYLTYNLRQQLLFILIPTLVIQVARDIIANQEPALKARHPHLPDIMLGTVAAIVALLAPVMLRYIWLTQPLPSGPLRDRLERLCKKLRMRCREILIWRSGGMVVNAAVMGLIAPLRYVLITDAMIEQMDDRKVEAVFGHEAGHVKHHHIAFFLMIALITGCFVSIVTVLTNRYVHAGGRHQEIIITSLGIALAIKWTFGFGWVSRRFERQADIFGVRTLALLSPPCTSPDCPLHAVAVPVSRPMPILHGAPTAGAVSASLIGGGPANASFDARHGPLCTSAASDFGDTLNEVAHLNGIPPEAGGLRHPSISVRSRFVQEVARNPEALRRFDQSVTALKWGIFTITLIACVWSGYLLKVWTLLQIRWF